MVTPCPMQDLPGCLGPGPAPCLGTVRQGHALCRTCWALVPQALQGDLSLAVARRRDGFNRHTSARFTRVLCAAKVAVELARRPAASLLCLSCPQPWCWAVVKAGCRSLPQVLPPLVPPGRMLWVALHAPGDVDAETLNWLRDEGLRPRVEPVNAVVAVAHLRGVVEGGARCQDPWARGAAWVWQLDSVVALPEPVPHQTCDPLWLPEPGLLDQIRRQWKAGRDLPPQLVTETMKVTFPWGDQ